MKTLAERVAALTPQQRLLLARTREKHQGEQPGDTIPARSGSGPWPACADQAALWFFQQVDADAVPYNIGNGQRMFGLLDQKTLELAYGQLVQRQEMLRARYPVLDGVAHVEIAPSLELPIFWEDVRQVSADERERAAEKRAALLINRPFDLENGPLIRFVVIRVADDEHLFVPVMHHSITDAVSYNIFFRELMAIYWSKKREKRIRLPPITRHYVDYGLWRNRWLEGEEYREQLAWWRETLAGAPTIADIPGDYPRPEVFSYRGSRSFFTIEQATTHALRSLNRRAGTTSLMTLLAATYALFYRYAGLNDMLIAVPASHREHREMAHVIGYFLNYVPFRGRVLSGMNFTRLLADTKTMVLGGLAHKRVPFSAIVEAVKPERDSGRMPLAQLGFVYVSAAGLNTEAAKLVDGEPLPFRIEGYYADREISPMDLQLIFMEGAEEVTCFLEYASDIFKPETMAQMASAFRVLFETCLADPERPIDRLPLLDQNGMSELGARWNPSVEITPVKPCETLHGLFLAQCRRTPDAVALRFEDRVWRYGELECRAAVIARRLSARGLVPGTSVGVCMRPCPEFVAAVLGVLLAGCVHVPVDPDFPASRRLAILGNTCAEVVLVTASEREPVGESGLPVLVVDQIADGDERSCIGSMDALRPAYIIHTSGSAGEPKGVLGTHLGLLHRLRWLHSRFPHSHGETHILYASLNINESLMEIFQALHYGGTLVIAQADVRKDPALLIGLLAAFAVERIQMVPSLLGLLLTRPNLERELAAMRLLVLQGETLPVDVAAAFRRRLPDCALVNNYGLTEATGCAAFRIRETAALPGPVPIGQSLGSMNLRLLDQNLSPLPPGAVGELFLAGAALAQGYVGRPELTAPRFIPDPEGRGTRLYRTGDRARFDPARGFTILSRSDRQVKVRGNRIEPAEVEAGLRRFPGVDEAVAAVVDGELVVFVQTSRPLRSETLRSHLLGRLPEYMVPSVFVLLGELPRTSGGKIDRLRLPDIHGAALRVGAVHVVPRNALEKTLASIWGRALKREKVGIDDDFYDLGGHSLKAAEIAAMIHRELESEVPLALFFQARTIRRLVEMLGLFQNWHQFQTGMGAVLLNQPGRDKLFAFPPLLGFAAVYRPLSQILPSVSLYGFDFLDVPEPPTVYADLIERVQPSGPLRLMGYSAGGNLAFETARLLEVRGRRVAGLILLDSFYRGGPKLAEHEIRERRAAYLADLELQLETDPVMGAFAAEPYLRGLIRKTPGAFFHYHYSQLDEGRIAAPIDYIRMGGADPERDPARADWERATTDVFRVHHGLGAHDAMLLGDALKTTASHLTHILS